MTNEIWCIGNIRLRALINRSGDNKWITSVEAAALVTPTHFAVSWIEALRIMEPNCNDSAAVPLKLAKYYIPLIGSERGRLISSFYTLHREGQIISRNAGWPGQRFPWMAGMSINSTSSALFNYEPRIGIPDRHHINRLTIPPEGTLECPSRAINSFTLASSFSLSLYSTALDEIKWEEVIKPKHPEN